jgi:MoaA/NifB/PqqE/SkfB family radical SAM enzyme
VAGACNYDCTYCIQSRRYRRGRADPSLMARGVDFFASLPGTWEIKCSGGEAFAHRAFLDVAVPGLMDRTSHRISVLTNLSASHSDLQRFVHLTRGRLSVFSASLHLEFVDAVAFADKADWLCDQLDAEVGFVVNQVVLPGHEAEALQCKQLLEDRGIRWFAQLFKTKGGIASYPDAKALRAVVPEGAGPELANRAPSYLGRMCWAGVDYFTIDKTGEVWSCRTAKRHGKGRLGNIYDGSASRLVEPSACPWTICPCTVPANRGMIDGIGPAA